MAPGSIETVRTLEKLAAHAWQPFEYLGIDGWLLRFNSGVSRRANSVWPKAHDGAAPLLPKLETVEARYRSWQVWARFQISPVAQPPELDRVLAEWGYAVEARFHVQTAAASHVLARASPATTRRVSITDKLTYEWLSTYSRATQGPTKVVDAWTSIFQRIIPPAAYALLEEQGHPVATGLAIQDGEWLGIYCIATHPAFRRLGAASAILHALAEWGQARGAKNAYLQVEEGNQTGRTLYERLGFSTCYQYHYRTKELTAHNPK